MLPNLLQFNSFFRVFLK